MTLRLLRTFGVPEILLLAAMMTPSTAAGQTTGTLTGVVLERGNGQPVVGADVRVDGTNVTALTNAVGRFQLEGVPVGRPTIVVRAAGFLELRLADVQVSTGGVTSVSAEL